MYKLVICLKVKGVGYLNVLKVGYYRSLICRDLIDTRVSEHC